MIMTSEDLAFMKDELCEKQGIGEDQLKLAAERNLQIQVLRRGQ